MAILCAGPVVAGDKPASSKSPATLFEPSKDPLVPALVFRDQDGVEKSLADFRGQPVLLHLWATWCPACVAEMMQIDALQAALVPDGIKVIALNLDHEGPTAAPQFYRRHSLSHLPVYTDPTGNAVTILHVEALPITFFINAEGVMLGHISGATAWNGKEAVTWVERELTH